VPARSPAAGRSASPPAASGRQPDRALPAPPLQASFRFEELARQIVVALVDPSSHEVVRQFPPEKILKMIVYLKEMASENG